LEGKILLLEILDADQTLYEIETLSEVLVDCVESGASLGFMLPYSLEEARSFWRDVAEAVRVGVTTHIVARLDGEIVGTVQLGLAPKPNQTHRADVMKLLVHRKARGKGISRQLMDRLEQEAVKLGRVVLVLDTATGSDAEAIYERFGWSRVGVIPNYARFPEGPLCGTTLFHKQIGPVS
jgi:GNAT superfamily N-acetyltransferase